MTTPVAEERSQAVLDIQGMTCASCVARVEKRLTRVDGVEATVNLATESARVSYPVALDPDELVQAVRAAGYDAIVRPRAVPAAEHPSARAARAPHDHRDVPGGTTLQTRLIVSAALALPVVALSMVPAWQFPGWQWLCLLLATPIVLWGGWPFHRATVAAGRHGAMTMDTLITLGTGAAYLWSLWAMLFGTAGRIGATHDTNLFGPVHDPSGLVYFEVTAAVTVFLLLGRVVEQRSKRRAGAAVQALLALSASDVELADGSRIPIEDLRVGDVFVTRPGEKIASDGRITTGRASVDQSMLTGESIPIEVGPGDDVTGGTLAVDGRLIIAATSVGADTRLAHMARLVEDAQAGKSRVQRLADRISAVFVPIVIALSLLTLVGWLLLGGGVAAGFTAAVAVLIIACPCALGLATPIAILVGTGRGAQLGILITGPEALESADRIDTVILDKTGTVTTGQMSVRGIDVLDPKTDAGTVARLVASLEQASEHPIARALAALSQSPASVADFTGHAGRGVTGAVDGHTVFAGRPAFAEAHAGELPAAVTTAVRRAEADGATAVVAGWDGRVRAVIAVADTVRPDSAAAVRRLRDLGLSIILLTGDSSGAAAAAARVAGIDDVISGVLPKGKVDEVRRAQAAGHRVAMVGDGINDAAALAAADLGIAMGGGTDAAVHASDIAVTGVGLEPVVTAIRLSRRTMAIIRGNLFWAFAYNVAALPLAAFGLLNPMIAGAAMAFSSVFVVLNSLRLRTAPGRTR
ncbi:heavy metal translocating P-type ATPase [Microbacterium sp.]|uniref:heavy metal translocating P-type ATPase n=1 Tax=Microbacterium sp. TaxID=51671 RepID=UPI0025FC2A19|nr:heavy metal translocating P-type ATPase [Microbacterium sp.]